MLTPSDYMTRALALAARGRGRTSPNPLVGAVIVSPDGVVVGQGFHERIGEAHAEVRALEEAGGRAKGATLYCTLEPCSHQGRTPPCATRVVEAGITRVVAATGDPNPLVDGQGFAFLRARGVSVVTGVGEDAAVAINQPFFTLMRTGRPFVVLKAATSLDGRIARAPGQRTSLTSAEANRHAQRVRAEVDAIGVGVGTVLIDDPRLTARDVYRERPLVRVIFDRQLRTPPEARVLSTREAGPVIIVTTAAGAADATRRRRLEERCVEIDVAPDGSLGAALRQLGRRGVTSILIEGGAAIHRAAWDEDLVDYVRVYVTPHVFGPDGVPLFGGRPFVPTSLLGRHVELAGPDVIIEGYVHRPR